MWLHAVLAVAALLTSVLSGMLGMAGGMLLLAVMFSFLSHAQTIPTHAAVQLVSNTTRLVAFARSIDWPTVARFLLGLIPGAVVGSVIYWRFGTPEASEPWLKVIVGAYILGVTLLPSPAKTGRAPRPWGFTAIGLAAGAAALTVGATGPLTAPIFARAGFVKERLVATKAVCQACGHVVKLPVFAIAGAMGKLAGVDLAGLGLLTLVMCLMVIPGTLIGKRILHSISDQLFTRLYQAALILAGAKVLVIDGIYPLLTR